MTASVEFIQIIYRNGQEHVLSVYADVETILEDASTCDAFGRIPGVAVKSQRVTHIYIWNNSEEEPLSFKILSLQDQLEIYAKAFEKASNEALGWVA